METTIVLLGLTILLMFGVIFFLCVKMEYLKIYKEKYFEMEKHASKCLETAKEFQSLCNKFTEEAKTDQARRNYYLTIIKCTQNALEYASAYLKPRKQKEMWHRANDFIKFEDNPNLYMQS